MMCPICGGRKARMEFSVTREEPDKYSSFLGKDDQGPAVYWECDNCEAMLWKSRPEYERIYDGFAYSSETGDPVKFIRERFEEVVSLPPQKSDNRKRVSRIRAFLAEQKLLFEKDESKDVLDVGAGMGVFLYCFLGNSWRGTAVEPDPNACNHMRDVLPRSKIIQGYFDKIDLQSTFDLITLNRMLEHVANPYTLMEGIRRLLKKAGFLYLELPDVRAYFHNGPHDQDFGYGHYIIYSPIALSYLGSRSDLELVLLNRVTEPSSKHTIYAFFRLPT